MEKSSVSPDDSSTTTTTTATCSNINGGVVNRDQFLKLNKVSHKISKPARRTAFDPPPQPQPPLPQPQPQPQLQPPPQQNQPPVYNISKSDFRDVVQKLTGSPAHERLSGTSCPIQPPKQPTSRLQRIRPPPLIQINNLVFPPHDSLPAGGAGYPIHFRPPPPVPFSPLPPLPPVYTSVVPPELPISAYMHFFHGQVSALDYDLTQTQNELVVAPPPQNLVSGPITTPTVMFRPSSPMSFGCRSPRSAA